MGTCISIKRTKNRTKSDIVPENQTKNLVQKVKKNQNKKDFIESASKALFEPFSYSNAKEGTQNSFFTDTNDLDTSTRIQTQNLDDDEFSENKSSDEEDSDDDFLHSSKQPKTRPQLSIIIGKDALLPNGLLSTISPSSPKSPCTPQLPPELATPTTLKDEKEIEFEQYKHRCRVRQQELKELQKRTKGTYII